MAQDLAFRTWDSAPAERLQITSQVYPVSVSSLIHGRYLRAAVQKAKSQAHNDVVRPRDP
jgi:hypothetical protein